MKITFVLVKETEKAALYERASGETLWIPKSVIRNRLKHSTNEA